MEITNLYCKIMNISKYSNWIFLFMETDSGLTGYGEATLDGFELQVEQMIEALKSNYIGKNPVEDNLTYNGKFKNLIEASVYSGIDMCIWDLKGKYCNKPVYELLGELKNQDVKMYATYNRALKTRTIDEFAEVSKLMIKRGFTGIKCAPFDDYTWQTASEESEKYLIRGVDRFKAIRKAVGNDIEIRVDNHWRFDYETSIRVADMLRIYNPYWFEAPVSEKDGKLVSSVKNSIGLKVSGAEMQYSIESLATLFENDALDVYMFDIKYIGGITGMLKANRWVLKLNRKLSPHNMTGPIATSASLHVCAVIDNLDSLEYHLEENPIIEKLSNLDMSLKDGKMRVPTKPGLGVELDMRIIKENPYKPTISFRANMHGA